MNVFQKAAAGWSLTPAERAFIKLVKSFATAGAMSLLLAVPTALSYVAGQPAITLAGLSLMVGAFVHGFMVAYEKYVSAQGDAPLAGALSSVDGAIQAQLAARYGGHPNTAKTLSTDIAQLPPPSAPGVPAPSSPPSAPGATPPAA